MNKELNRLIKSAIQANDEHAIDIIVEHFEGDTVFTWEEYPYGTRAGIAITGTRVKPIGSVPNRLIKEVRTILTTRLWDDALRLE